MANDEGQQAGIWSEGGDLDKEAAQGLVRRGADFAAWDSDVAAGPTDNRVAYLPHLLPVNRQVGCLLCSQSTGQWGSKI